MCQVCIDVQKKFHPNAFQKAGEKCIPNISIERECPRCHKIHVWNKDEESKPSQSPEQERCGCESCKTYLHKSDCAVHQEPARPNGPCDCRPSDGVDNKIIHIYQSIIPILDSDKEKNMVKMPWPWLEKELRELVALARE
jgi:hypothetical protein